MRSSFSVANEHIIQTIFRRKSMFPSPGTGMLYDPWVDAACKNCNIASCVLSLPAGKIEPVFCTSIRNTMSLLLKKSGEDPCPLVKSFRMWSSKFQEVKVLHSEWEALLERHPTFIIVGLKLCLHVFIEFDFFHFRVKCVFFVIISFHVCFEVHCLLFIISDELQILHLPVVPFRPAIRGLALHIFSPWSSSDASWEPSSPLNRSWTQSSNAFSASWYSLDKVCNFPEVCS